EEESENPIRGHRRLPGGTNSVANALRDSWCGRGGSYSPAVASQRRAPSRPLTDRVPSPTVLAMTTSRSRLLAVLLLVSVIITGVVAVSLASAAEGGMR